jgi:hypothetical protein
MRPLNFMTFSCRLHLLEGFDAFAIASV